MTLVKIEGKFFRKGPIVRVLRSSCKDESSGLLEVVINFESSANMNGIVRILWVRSRA